MKTNNKTDQQAKCASKSKCDATTDQQESQPISSDELITCVNGMDDSLYAKLGLFGRGFISVSNQGVDMAVRSDDLSGMALDNDGFLWWPEQGVRMNKNVLSAVHAFDNSSISAPALECDFDTSPGGLAFYFLPRHCDKRLFWDVMDTYRVGGIPVQQLMLQRNKMMPAFNNCPCCIARAERIMSSVETHILSRVLADLSASGKEVEFQIKSKHVGMTCQWVPGELMLSEGHINVTGKGHTLHINAMAVHALRIYKHKKCKQEYSVMMCYNSLGEVMLEMSVEGAQYLSLWNKICQSNHSDYKQMPNGVFVGI